MAVIVQRTTTYAVCPSCGKDAGRIDHLLGQTLRTQWYCDACGIGYNLEFSTDGVVVTVAEGKRKVTTIDVLVLKPHDKPVYFVVEGMRFEGEGHDDVSEADKKEFYYNEHSCPTNWFKPTVVAFDGDDDPHGLIEFVATRDDTDFPKDETHGPNDRDFALRAFIEESAAKQ